MLKYVLTLLLTLLSLPAAAQTDAINLKTATIVNAVDVSGWPITTAITTVSFQQGITRVQFSKQDGQGRWPDVTPPGWDGPLQYTLWLFVKNGDTWAGSAFIQFWHGRDGSGYPGDPDVPSKYHQNWYYSQRWSPVYGHGPIQPGETIGFMVTSGNQRDKVGPDSVRERSNVVTFKATDEGVINFTNQPAPEPLPTPTPDPVPAPTPVPPPTPVFSFDPAVIFARLDALEAGLLAATSRISVLESRPIPVSCTVSALYGIRLSCKLGY